MLTRAEWEKLTRGWTAKFTDAQIEQITDRLVAADAAGNPSSVWHEAAAVAGTKCWCSVCNPKTKHPFEKAGLGLAPFRLIGVERRVGPYRYTDPKSGVELQSGAPGQPMGTCDYCGTGIANCCLIVSKDGKRFIVGTDCVAKTYRDAATDDAARLATDVERQLRELQKQAKAARIEDVRAFLESSESERVRSTLNAKPHPSAGMAERGATLLDYVGWLLRNAGASGMTKAARIVAKEQRAMDRADDKEEARVNRCESIEAARNEERAHGSD